MGGLLYKDYVLVNRIHKGKLTWLLLLLTLLFIILRMAFPGTMDDKAFLAENEAGEIVNLLDAFFVTIYGIFLIGLFSLLNGWIGKIASADRKNKIENYLQALPITGHTYLASKYIFLLAAAYAGLSLSCIWYISCLAFCREGIMAETVEMLGSFLPIWAVLFLFLAAIELPFYLLLGVERAKQILTGFLLVLAFVCIGYFLFGDLSWIAGFDVTVLVSWCKRHNTAIVLLNGFSPVFVLLLYYGSYRLTAYLAQKEVDHAYNG